MVHILPALKDNYIYVIQEGSTAAAIDPSEAEPVLEFCRQNRVTLTHIFNTHHHWDHVGGNLKLLETFGCEIYGSKHDEGRVPGLTRSLSDGDTFEFGSWSFEVLDIPGHTLGHTAFYSAAKSVVFTGDTLFSLGCGRLFEGTAEMMFTSLARLRALPVNTKVYCGHEYTVRNAEFALNVDPCNSDLLRRFETARALRAAGLPTLPVRLADELATNPFLRVDSPAIQSALGMVGASDVDVFAELRRRKDLF